jgi:hypothetical protein
VAPRRPSRRAGRPLAFRGLLPFHVPLRQGLPAAEDARDRRHSPGRRRRHRLWGCHHSYQRSYQRSYPLRFQKNARIIGPLLDYDTAIDGRFTLDRKFDGKAMRTGGHHLYHHRVRRQHPAQRRTDPAPGHMATLHRQLHCGPPFVTLMEVGHSELTIRQIGADGQELDHIIASR